MDLYIEKMKAVIEVKNGIASADDLQKAGLSRLAIYNSYMNGFLRKESHGNYSLADWQPDKYRVIQSRSNKVIFSYATALYLHGMINQEPENCDVTVPQGDNVSKMKRDFEDLHFHYCKKELWPLGLEEILTPEGFPVRVYDPERCICDLVRDKKNVDEAVFVQALKEYFANRCDSEKIISYSKRMNQEKRIKAYMEVLKG